jgi:hypothetical protein
MLRPLCPNSGRVALSFGFRGARACAAFQDSRKCLYLLVPVRGVRFKDEMVINLKFR